MIDFRMLFKYLLRFKWIIILAPVVGVAAAYFFVQKLPDTYKSVAQVSALSAASTPDNGGNFQLASYVVELAQSKRLINALGYQLILHDLESEEIAFKAWTEELKSVSDSYRLKAIQAFEDRLRKRALLSVADNSDSLKLFDMVNSMGYGESKLLDKLEVSRNNVTGIIDIAFVSENPDLSVFTVNTLSSDLIQYFNSRSEANNDNSLALLDSVLQEKLRIVNEKKTVLNRYKAGIGVVSAGAQTSALYGRVTNYEQERAAAIRNIEAIKGAIKSIDERLEIMDKSQRGMDAGSSLLVLDQQLDIANQRYVDGGFRVEDKLRVDSLQRVRSTMIAASTQNEGSAAAKQARQELRVQRRSLETDLASAESGLVSIENELANLRGRFNAMMPADANVQQYEQEYEIANEEYLDALERYNAATMSNSSSIRLSMMDYGLPGLPENSKKIIYLGASGVASTTICFAVLLWLFFTDRRVTTPFQLELITNDPVLGELNAVTQQGLEMGELWRNDHGLSDFKLFKSRLRALRFDIDKALDTDKGRVLLVTSLNSGDGKTFLSSGLAYAFAKAGKRVLLISKAKGDELPIVLRNNKAIPQNFVAFVQSREIEPRDLITLLQIKAGDQSLMELTDQQSLDTAFDVLKNEFDLVIIDAPEMHDISQIREWLSFADGMLAVFRRGMCITEDDRSVIQRFNQQSRFLGWIFNEAK